MLVFGRPSKLDGARARAVAEVKRDESKLVERPVEKVCGDPGCVLV